MNRRDLLKAAVVAPVVGIVKPTKAKAGNPDWGDIVTGQGLGALASSVCSVLELFLNGDGVRASHPVSVVWYSGYSGEPFPNQHAIFDIGGYHGFDVNLIEYNRNDRGQMINLIQTRWTDWLWCMDDNINERIRFIHRFDPDYKPEEADND